MKIEWQAHGYIEVSPIGSPGNLYLRVVDHDNDDDAGVGATIDELEYIGERLIEYARECRKFNQCTPGRSP